MTICRYLPEGEISPDPVKADGKQVFTGLMENGEEIKEIRTSLNGADDIMVEFEGRNSPDILGISIESRTGIIIDNIPRRGSAGLEFTLVDRDNLKESLRMLSPDLVVLQYGLNIVRNVREDYSYYERGLYRQLTLLKEISPETPVLVIGVTDMAAVHGGERTSSV